MTKQKLVFEVTDFKYSLEEKEGKVTGLKMTGTALKEGLSRNKRNYTIQNLKENDGELFNFIVAHRQDYDNPDHNVGEGAYYLNGSKLDFEGKIYNNHHHPDIIEQVNKGLVSVSIQGGFTDVGVKDGKVAFEGLRIPILALVNKHARGVEAASIESAIAERLEQEDKGEDKMTEDFAKILQEKEDALKRQSEELVKIKEVMQGKEEEMKKMMKNKLDEDNAKKKKLAESLVSINKELKVEELMEKSFSELELMEKYENKMKESQGSVSEGVSEVQDTFKPGESDGIVIEKATGYITMSETARLKFNNDLMNSIYR